MSESESVDVQIDRISERIEILEITNKVLRERIDSIALRISLLKGQMQEEICEVCEGDGWVYKRVDVDAEKRVPCECGLGDPE